MIPCALALALVLGALVLAAGCSGTAKGTGGGTPGTQSTPAAGPVTPAQGPVVAADAYPPAEPHEIDPRFVRNTPGYRVDPALFAEVYHDQFTLNYNSIGLLVTVDRAPLVVDFSVTPGSRDPVYSFFIITVRDGDSREVIGQEGYGRTFSTDSPKRLVFTSPGRYHLNLYGNLVSGDLSILMKK